MNMARVIELFAGVGGFRIGLDRVRNGNFRTIWSNQYEPSTKIQHASKIYIERFGSEGHVNRDITLVPTIEIPNHDMLVGGFPCQDYSVATSLNRSKGLEGKKGVLWWEICRILKEKGENKPSILFLENVDRLLLSPSTQRGRDFAIILASLSELGYIVEWRMINAAEYGMPQKRRRTYILAYLQGTEIANQVVNPTEWIFEDGVFATAFPVRDYEGNVPLRSMLIKGNKGNSLLDISNEFNSTNKLRPFGNAGIMINKEFWTYQTISNYQGEYTTLGDILVTGDDRRYLTEDFFIPTTDLERWNYVKGAKSIPRVKADGTIVNYTEGAMNFPDNLDTASRTIITSEGGKSPDRTRHAVLDESGRYRRLLPIELERLNMFDDNHTLGVPNSRRAFFMGNALVVGVVTKVGEVLANRVPNL